MVPGETRRDRIIWSVGALALVWNGLGCVNLVQQMGTSGLDSLPEEYRALVEGRPGWQTAAFALSVIAGFLGAVLLILRHPSAVWAFALSGVGAARVVIPIRGSGPPSVIAGTAMSAVLAAALAVFSRRMLR